MAPRSAYPHARDIGDTKVVDENVTCVYVQSGARTIRARLRAEIFCKLLAGYIRFGLALAALHVRNHAFKRVLANHAATPLIVIGEGNFLLAASVEDDVAYGFF